MPCCKEATHSNTWTPAHHWPTPPLQRAEKKLPIHQKQFANVCSTTVLFIFIIYKNLHWRRGGMGEIYFSLFYGLPRVVLRKGSEGTARWQSGLSHGKAGWRLSWRNACATPGLSQPRRRVKLQLPKPASYLQHSEKQKFACKKLAGKTDPLRWEGCLTPAEGELQTKRGKEPTLLLTEQHNLWVLSLQGRTVHEKQAVLTGWGVSALFVSTVSQCTFPTPKEGGREGERQATLQEGLPHFLIKKEVCHHLLMILHVLGKVILPLNSSRIIFSHSFVTKSWIQFIISR